jgi:hypothetical protein
MTAYIFEILESHFKELFEYYGISNIIDGEIISAISIPELTQEKIFTFYQSLEKPSLVVETSPQMIIGDVKVSFATSVIDGEACLTSVIIGNDEMLKMSATKQAAFISWLKDGIERFSVDETPVNQK